MSKFEILCVTMHQTDFSKIKEMNIHSDVVFSNQADTNSYEEKEFEGHIAKMITTNTRGASINRNLAILYSTADIVVFADDDQEFVDGYENMILDEFKNHPEADAIKFFCISTDKERPLAYKQAPRFQRAKLRNLMSAGPHALAIRREMLLRRELRFAEHIGPGRELYCGEDSFFYKDMLDKGVAVYESPLMVSYVHQEKSTWFEGYTERYFLTVGYIYAKLYGALATLAMIRRAYRIHRSRAVQYSMMDMIRMMRKGIVKYKE